MSFESLVSLILVIGVIVFVLSVCNAVLVAIRFRRRYAARAKDYETELIRSAAKRDAYEDIARFAREYYDDPQFSLKIRQLYYTQLICPECNGKGKKWQNSRDKCEFCWGTGKQLKE